MEFMDLSMENSMGYHLKVFGVFSENSMKRRLFVEMAMWLSVDVFHEVIPVD